MKKIYALLLCLCLVFASAIGFAGCENRGSALTFYTPDGAPALAAARFMSEDVDLGRDIDFRVVGAEEIASSVTYTDADRNADLCILPVNTASKLLGDGERYMLLGAVTHGNLFIVAGRDKDEITPDNFAESFSGKRVGVVNLPNFPGAVLKLILSKYGISGSVALENVAPSAVSGTDGTYDYFVMPEPAASTRSGAANLNLKIVGSLQNLYGENGYPQAVLVAKKSLIQSDPQFISLLMNEMSVNAEWLLKEETTPQTVISAISAHSSDPNNTAATFNVNNLDKTVIRNCAVSFEAGAACKQAVISVLEELKAAGDAAAAAVSDNFFYIA